MIELKSILNNYRDKFVKKYKGAVNQQQYKAMSAVSDCRTERYGTMALNCSACEYASIQYHACGNRACPKCQNHDATKWLEKQATKLLPVEYFMVTFTLPRELRSLVQRHQKVGYNLLLDCAKNTLKTFAKNAPSLAGNIGMTAVLHTHSRKLDYHPHVHVIIPGVSVNNKRNQCSKLKGKYLFNGLKLAKVFRAKFVASMAENKLVTKQTYPKKWVAHCKHVGDGLPALKYLSRYLYRGVISEKNILSDNGTDVTFSYLESATNTYKTRTVKGEVFLWLVFQHSLPKGFRRVRDYGFLNGNGRMTLYKIQKSFGLIIERLLKTQRPMYPCKRCGGILNITAFVAPSWQSG